MTKVRVARTAAAVMVTTVVGTAVALVGCTSTPASPRPSTPSSTPSSMRSPVCTGRDGEAVLRAFFRDLSNHRNVSELLAAYVAPPENFVRWWDPSTPSGGIVTYVNGLPEHLEKLQRDGIDLTVTGFQDAGFQGRGTPDEGGWFTFGLYGRFREGQPMGGGETLGNKGAVDCATGKLKAIVL